MTMKKSIPKIVNVRYKDPKIELIEPDERPESVVNFINSALILADNVPDVRNFAIVIVTDDGDRQVAFDCGDIPAGYFGEYIKKILDSYQF